MSNDPTSTDDLLDDLDPQDADGVKGGSVEPDEYRRLRQDPQQFAEEYPDEVVRDIKPLGP